jgi:hypothetical protein
MQLIKGMAVVEAAGVGVIGLSQPVVSYVASNGVGFVMANSLDVAQFLAGMSSRNPAIGAAMGDSGFVGWVAGHVVPRLIP